jgi:hypothetical protein
MIRAATPEEKKQLPPQHKLAGYWQRWLKGEHIPDGHRGDPNNDGFYRPIIARMMGTTPEKIWPYRRTADAEGAWGELMLRRDRAAGRLSRLRRDLDDLRRQVQRIPDVEVGICKLEAELTYLDAMLAVPVPETT